MVEAGRRSVLTHSLVLFTLLTFPVSSTASADLSWGPLGVFVADLVPSDHEVTIWHEGTYREHIVVFLHLLDDEGLPVVSLWFRTMEPHAEAGLQPGGIRIHGDPVGDPPRFGGSFSFPGTGKYPRMVIVSTSPDTLLRASSAAGLTNTRAQAEPGKYVHLQDFDSAAAVDAFGFQTSLNATYRVNASSTLSAQFSLDRTTPTVHAASWSGPGQAGGSCRTGDKCIPDFAIGGPAGRYAFSVEAAALPPGLSSGSYLVYAEVGS